MTRSSTYALLRLWHDLLEPFAPAPQITAEFDQLAQHYRHPSRHYHNLDHITAVLDSIHHLHPASSPSLQLAGWLHDVVYDSQKSDNEERSADYVQELPRRLSLPEAIAKEAARLIQLTKTHTVDATDSAGLILLDADLAILSADEADYDAYATAIRREYAWVADADFCTGRSRVLERFLTRPAIYGTKTMRGREERARANLRREIARLQQGILLA